MTSIEDLFRDFQKTLIGYQPMMTGLKHATTVSTGYPPYNIEHLSSDTKDTEGRVNLSLAVAGFSIEDIKITYSKNILTVTGHKAKQESHQFYYQGIAERDFKKSFVLADNMVILKASLKDGILLIELKSETKSDSVLDIKIES